jgi:hypothetical protein
MSDETRAIIDDTISRFVSRKFLAWLTACVMTGLGYLGPDEWVAVTLAYVGTQGLVDAAVQWKHGGAK